MDIWTQRRESLCSVCPLSILTWYREGYGTGLDQTYYSWFGVFAAKIVEDLSLNCFAELGEMECHEIFTGHCKREELKG